MLGGCSTTELPPRVQLTTQCPWPSHYKTNLPEEAGDLPKASARREQALNSQSASPHFLHKQRESHVPQRALKEIHRVCALWCVCPRAGESDMSLLGLLSERREVCFPDISISSRRGLWVGQNSHLGPIYLCCADTRRPPVHQGPGVLGVFLTTAQASLG